MQLIRFNLKSHLIFYFILIAIVTFLFRLTNLDLTIGDFWFQLNDPPNWASSDHSFWGWVYTYGTAPGTLLLLISFIFIAYTLIIDDNKLTRIKAICVILAIVIGPGIIVHGILKHNMGRPRPYDIIRYGGSEQFLKIMQLGVEGDSFPSGHASAGFVLTILFYIFYCHRKKLAWFCLAGSLFLGVLLSLTRIVQGGHFASDVFWSFGITQIVNCLLYFKLVFPLECQNERHKKFIQMKSARKWIFFYVFAITLSLFFIFGFFLNSSITRFMFFSRPISSQTKILKINCTLPEEKIVLKYGANNQISIDFLVLANGFSWSEFHPILKKESTGNHVTVNIKIEKSGMTRDYSGRIKIIVPRNIVIDIQNVSGKFIENKLN